MAAQTRTSSRLLLVVSSSVALFAVLARAVSSEMFLDGVTYAAIARNMAFGQGSFWAPHYTAHLSPFHQHPPLAMWAQSLAFRVFGDRPGIEYWWGVGLTVVSCVLLVVVWRVAHACAGGTGVRVAAETSWWPLLLLTSFPLFSWCAANNMLENTLLPMSLAAIALALAAARERSWRAFPYGIGSGVAAFLCVLVKGPPGLFALVTPACAALLHRTPGRASRGLVVVAAGFVAAALVTAALGGGAARAFAAGYVRDQLVPSVSGARELASCRFQLVRALAIEAVLPVALAAAGVLLAGRRASRRRVPRTCWFFLALGVCAAGPFVLFRKQMDWYLAPALPLLAMALASFTGDAALSATRTCAAGPRARRALVVMSLALVVSGGVLAGPLARLLPVSGVVGLRDAWRELRTGQRADDRQSEYAWSHFKRDILDQHMTLATGATMSAAAPYSLWRLVAYMERYYGVGVTPRMGESLLLVEQAPGEPAQASVNCVRLQPQVPARFFVFRCVM
jgi:hypothetical protein